MCGPPTGIRICANDPSPNETISQAREESISEDGMSQEDIAKVVVEAMVKVQMPPKFIHAFQRTGVIVTSCNSNTFTEQERNAWHRAIKDYFERQGMPESEISDENMLSISEAERLQKAPAACTLAGKRDRVILELLGAGTHCHELPSAFRVGLLDDQIVVGFRKFFGHDPWPEEEGFISAIARKMGLLPRLAPAEKASVAAIAKSARNDEAIMAAFRKLTGRDPLPSDEELVAALARQADFFIAATSAEAFDYWAWRKRQSQKARNDYEESME